MLLKKVFIQLFFIVFTCSAIAGGWQNDPLVKSTSCLNVNGKEVMSFIQKYSLPSLIFSKNREKAEKKLLQSYILSSALLTRSQICLAEALEIKGVTEDLKKQQVILTSGTSFDDKKALKNHRKLSKKVDKKINKALAKNKELKPAQKKVFTVGTTIYGGANYTFIELNKAYADYFGDNVKSVKNIFSLAATNPIGAAKNIFKKAGTITVIGKGISTLWPMTVSTGKDIFTYSKDNNIEVDKDIAAKVGW